MIVGENIAAGFDSTGATCRGWMNSPGHRANILRPSFTRVGAGYASGESEYGRYYVQVFADVPGLAPRREEIRLPRPSSSRSGASMRGYDAFGYASNGWHLEGRGRRR